MEQLGFKFYYKPYVLYNSPDKGGLLIMYPRYCATQYAVVDSLNGNVVHVGGVLEAAKKVGCEHITRCKRLFFISVIKDEQALELAQNRLATYLFNERVDNAI